MAAAVAVMMTGHTRVGEKVDTLFIHTNTYFIPNYSSIDAAAIPPPSTLASQPNKKPEEKTGKFINYVLGPIGGET